MTAPAPTAPPKPKEMRFGPLCVLPPRRVALFDGVAVRLTALEYDVLEMLALAGGRPVPKEHIVRVAFGREFRAGRDQAASRVIHALRRRLPPLLDGGSMILTVVFAGFALRLFPGDAQHDR